MSNWPTSAKEWVNTVSAAVPAAPVVSNPVNRDRVPSQKRQTPKIETLRKPGARKNFLDSYVFEYQPAPFLGKDNATKKDHKNPRPKQKTTTEFIVKHPPHIVAMGLVSDNAAGSSSEMKDTDSIREPSRISPDCQFLPIIENDSACSSNRTFTASNNNVVVKDATGFCSSSSSRRNYNRKWDREFSDMDYVPVLKYHNIPDLGTHQGHFERATERNITPIISQQRERKNPPDVFPPKEIKGQSPRSSNSKHLQFQGPFEYGIRQVGKKFFGRPSDLKLEATDFQGRLLGFDKRSYAYIQMLDNEKIQREFESMKKTMAEVYSEKMADYYVMKASQIELNELLVAKICRNTFARVRVLAIRLGENLILVVDVDDESIYEVVDAQLYPIDKEFLNLPFMSIRCQLFGLEYLQETDSIGTVMPRLFGSPRMNITIIKKTIIPIVLIVPLDQKKSFNQIVKKALSRFNPFPGVFEIGMQICNGKVIHVDEEQHIWYQIPTPILDFLTNLKPTMDIPENREEMNLQLVSEGIVKFAAPSKVDAEKYVRVIIVPDTSLPESDVKVMYMDYGIDAIIPINDLVPFHYFDIILNKIPPQCAKFCLDPSNQLNLTAEYLAKMEVLQMNHVIHICKLSNDGNPPKVECMIFFPDIPDENISNVIMKRDKRRKYRGSNDGFKKLTFTDGLDVAIHKYEPISQKPMSQVTVQGFPHPFNSE